MDALIQFLVSYGYTGMLISAFIAGSFLPFSSEAVMTGLVAAGLEPLPLLIYGTIGNWAGSMFNYCVGRMGKMEWVERYLHVSQENMEKAQRFMGKRGAWMGFFAFLPVIGTAICITLGLMRANPSITAVSVFLGKVIRYFLVAYGAAMVF
ncbi:MAG: DedA family protein [Prevotella sp.]|nr:DedA family protein [Prevotella sp.]MBR7055109.1 DedA family protein [Prevotella sp.]